MQKIRCPKCGKVLFFANLADLEIKCSKCKEIIQIRIREK